MLFSWIEWPSREARDSGMKAMMQDERMKTLGMPFDGQRLIFGGFSPIVETGISRAARAMRMGSSCPCRPPIAMRMFELALNASRVFKEYGALRVVEAWGDDVPDGKVTDFRRAVAAKDGEVIVFSFIEWPSKRARDEAWPKLMANSRMQPDKANMPFDGRRMIYGEEFATLLDA